MAVLRRQYLEDVTPEIDPGFVRSLKKLEDRLFVVWNHRKKVYEIHRSCGLNPSKYVLTCNLTLDRNILERLALSDTRRNTQFDTFNSFWTRFEMGEETSMQNEERKDFNRLADINEIKASKMMEAMEGLNFGSHMGREPSAPRGGNLCIAKK